MYKFINLHIIKEQTYYKIHVIFLKTCHNIYIHSILNFFSKKKNTQIILEILVMLTAHEPR